MLSVPPRRLCVANRPSSGGSIAGGGEGSKEDGWGRVVGGWTEDVGMLRDDQSAQKKLKQSTPLLHTDLVWFILRTKYKVCFYSCQHQYTGNASNFMDGHTLKGEMLKCNESRGGAMP